MLKLALLVFAIVVFCLIATQVIDSHALEWAAGGEAAFAASFLPLPG